MADPLSIAASVAGLIMATNSLVKFYTTYKHQDSNLVEKTKMLEGMSSLFQSLEETLSKRDIQANERNLIEKIRALIEECNEPIENLRSQCLKFDQSPSQGIKAAVKVAARRVAYPFRQETLNKLAKDIVQIHCKIFDALEMLQLKGTQRTQDSISEIRTDQISWQIRDWLKAPDVSVNHNAECQKKHGWTGRWLVTSPSFITWLVKKNSLLWLNGFAGSGKSVLCSTAIQYVFRHRQSASHIGVAYFYFTFNDESKQDESAMLRALLLQLSVQRQDDNLDLTRLYNLYKPGIPPSLVLTDHLHRLVQKFRDVYIVLDALDESPRSGAREQVLDTLETMRKWSFPGMHFLITSRDEPDIRESLESLTLFPMQQVKMKNARIDKDIADFISGRLRSRRLQKWSLYHDKIQEVLVNRAKGV
jgi:ankyrin repeat domain-containing protein 50